MTAIQESHGIVDAGKVTMMSERKERQSVEVSDGTAFVYLALSTSSYPAALTPEQAKFIARQLVAAANRVTKNGTAS